MTKLSKFNCIFEATKIKDEIQDVLDVALTLNHKFIKSLEILKIIQDYKKSLNTCKETNNLCEKFPYIYRANSLQKIRFQLLLI